jgi:hypothetical protein
MDRQAAEDWAIRINLGQATQEQFRSYISKLARSQFGSISDQFDSGLTPGGYMAPIRSTVAQLLDMQPGDVDLMGSRFRDLLYHYDDKNKVTRPKTIREAEQWARQQREFRYSATGLEEASQLGEQLARTFGAVR